MILAAVAYWNSFSVPMVFDDLLTIQANSGVQFGENLRPSIWATRPVLYLTFALNYRLHGQEVWGYHLVNFALHILNGILVLLIAIHIFRRVASTEKNALLYALLAAAFFIVHPVQTESVTFISSRSELLSTAFYSLAFLAFIKRDEAKVGFLWSFVVAIPFLLGLFAKETVISLPAALLVYDFLFLSKGRFNGILSRWRFYVTFVAGGVAAAFFFVTALLSGTVGARVSQITTWQYFLTELRVIVTYIRLLIFPARLNLDYDFRRSTSLLEFPVIGSLVVLLGLLYLAWRLRSRQPVIAFSILWFFVTLAPTSSVVPIPDVIFEHRLYLPLVGVSLAFPLLVAYGATLVRPRLKIPVAAACSVLLLVLCAATVLRNQVWQDEVRLWSDVISKSPSKARPYNSLATLYFNRRQFDKALEVARSGRQMVEIPSAQRAFQQMIGQIYIQMRRYDEAIATFRETVDADDKRVRSAAYNNIGIAYLEMANARSSDKESLLTEAAAAFRKSSDIDEGMLFAFDSYVNLLYQIGKKDALENELRAELEKAKDYRAYYGLGKIAFQSGDYARAVEHFEEAIRQNSYQKLVFFHLAYALNQLQRRDEAIEKYLQTLRLDPLFVQARHNLGLLYMQAGEFPNAIDSFENVVQLDPNYLSAHLNLAKIYIRMGNTSIARDHLSKVLGLAPKHEEAMGLLKQLGS
jgi:tetratricopeptide (TPR) repeat protein